MKVKLQKTDEAGDAFAVGMAEDDESPIFLTLGNVTRVDAASWLFKPQGLGPLSLPDVTIEATDADALREHFGRTVTMAEVPFRENRLSNETFDAYAEAMMLPLAALAESVEAVPGFLSALASIVGATLHNVAGEDREGAVGTFTQQIRLVMQAAQARESSRETFADALKKILHENGAIVIAPKAGGSNGNGTKH